MNSTLDQQRADEKPSRSLAAKKPHILPIQHSLLTHAMHHHPRSGLNPAADAAGNLFTIIGKLRQYETWPDLGTLHSELVTEITAFYDTIKNHGYSTEYSVVCRYVICATLDEIIGWNTTHTLLGAFSQDEDHQEKFFAILERILKEPALYIDLMELMYLSLSMEYKGRYRNMEHGQYQLEQVTNSLYKHIRAYRGSFSKTLSPTPFKPMRSATRNKTSLRSIFIVTACVILTILISLGYLMDVIANEPYQNVHQTERKN